MFNIRNHVLIKYTGDSSDVIIPEGVTSIGRDAFFGCTGLTSVVIPAGVTSIGNYAFYGCTGLTSVVIPEGVTSIGEWAFYGCTGLTSVVIPERVTNIGEWAFADCTGLTSVVIPEGVTSIGEWAFAGCTGLTSVVIPAGVTSIGNHTFDDCNNLALIVVGDSEVERITPLLPLNVRGKVVKESFFNEVKKAQDTAYKLLLNPPETSSLYRVNERLNDILPTISYYAETHKEHFSKAISKVPLPSNEEGLISYREDLQKIAKAVRSVLGCIQKLERYSALLQTLAAKQEERSPGFFQSQPAVDADFKKELENIGSLIHYLKGDERVVFSVEDKRRLDKASIAKILEGVNLKPADLPGPDAAGRLGFHH